MPNKRGVKVNGGRGEIFVKFNKREGGGISKNPLIGVMNDKKHVNV